MKLSNHGTYACYWENEDITIRWSPGLDDEPGFMQAVPTRLWAIEKSTTTYDVGFGVICDF